MITIASINIGLPRHHGYGDGPKFRSGIFKQPATGKIFLNSGGLEGDGSADLVHHRGDDKALCVYPLEHYSFWREEWSRDLQPGVFGENLTLEGLVETQIHIGDRFRIGEAEVECSQPRQPCHKLNKVFGSGEMAPKVQERGYTGYYLRVTRTGYIQAGDTLALVESDPRQISIDECNQVMYHDRSNRDRLLSVLNHPLLSESWKQPLYNRADKLEAKP